MTAHGASTPDIASASKHCGTGAGRNKNGLREAVKRLSKKSGAAKAPLFLCKGRGMANSTQSGGGGLPAPVVESEPRALHWAEMESPLRGGGNAVRYPGVGGTLDKTNSKLACLWQKRPPWLSFRSRELRRIRGRAALSAIGGGFQFASNPDRIPMRGWEFPMQGACFVNLRREQGCSRHLLTTSATFNILSHTHF